MQQNTIKHKQRKTTAKLYHLKNEVGFMCQRSLLQVPMKLASLGIEACFVFETDFLQLGQIVV